MKHRRFKNCAISIFAIVILQITCLSQAVSASRLGFHEFWPGLYDGVTFPDGNYNSSIIAITASEYPDQSDLRWLKDAEIAQANALLKVIVIPGLNYDTAQQSDYDLTLRINDPQDFALSMELPKANYYLPQRYTLRAADGRSCPIYIVAIPEFRDYLSTDFSQVYAEWLNIKDSVMDLYNELIEAEKAVVGGYHPENQRCLSTLCACLGGLGVQFTEEIIQGVDSNEELADVMKNRLREANVLSPDQLMYILRALIPWYMDYCRATIAEPTLHSLTVLGAEAKGADGVYELCLPAGVDWVRAAAYLRPEAVGDYVVTTKGRWTAGGNVRLTLSAWDRATGVVYDDEKTGVVQTSAMLQLSIGNPVFGLHALRVGGREAEIDGEAGTVSLRLGEDWDWLQVPEPDCSGTGWALLDAAGTPLAPDSLGRYDLSRAKTLRLTLDLTELMADPDAQSVFTKDYALALTRGVSPDCDIISCTLGVEGEKVEIEGASITVTLPYAADWTGLRAEFRISYDAELIRPEKEDYAASGDRPLSYTVVAQDGLHARTYRLRVLKAAPSADARLLAFRYGSLEGTVDHGAGTVSLTLPAGSPLTFAPNLEAAPYASVSPPSGTPLDFSTPQIYTITAQSGDTRTYTVTVTLGAGAENPHRERLEVLLGNIISTYRSAASDDWEWLDLGLYLAPDTEDPGLGYPIAEKIGSMVLGPEGIMTDLDRLTLTLTLLGYDCSNLAKYNGGQPFWDAAGNPIDDLVKNICTCKDGGISGMAFGLLALDCGQYTLPAGTLQDRASLAEALLAYPYGTSGFGLDMDCMVMYAIASCLDDPEYHDRVQAKLEEGAEFILANMREDYTFKSFGTVNSEVSSQVICALCAAGVDVCTDPRFGDGEKNVLTQWLDLFALPSGFKHVQSETDPNFMGTYEACYTLQWYLGFLEGGGNGHPYQLYRHRRDFSRSLSGEAEILSFTLEGKTGTIGEDDAIALTLPEGMPLTGLSPILTLSPGAALEAPALPVTFVPGVAQAFTVLAEDGVTRRTYAVTVTLSAQVGASGAELYSESLRVQDANRRELTVLDRQLSRTEAGADLLLTLDTGAELTALRLLGEVSFGAAADPALDGETLLDLTDWQSFTVTSGDGTNVTRWRVRVQVQGRAEIVSFALTVGGTRYAGTIDQAAGTITVPNIDASGLHSTLLSPEIGLGEGTTVCFPLPGQSQDFSAPVVYTVSGPELRSTVYTVTVTDTTGAALRVQSDKDGRGTGTGAGTGDGQITAFQVLGVSAEIDQSLGTILLHLPYGTDVCSVRPVITVSGGRALSPAPGAAVDLRRPTVYVLSLEEGTKTYLVSVLFQRTASSRLWQELEERMEIAERQVSRGRNLTGGR